MACKEGIWLTKLLTAMKIDVQLPIQIYEDNSGCIFIAKNPETKRSKHIDVKFHYLRECVWEKKIELIPIESRLQIADVFTKGLPKTKFWEFLNQIGIQRGILFTFLLLVFKFL